MNSRDRIPLLPELSLELQPQRLQATKCCSSCLEGFCPSPPLHRANLSVHQLHLGATPSPALSNSDSPAEKGEIHILTSARTILMQGSLNQKYCAEDRAVILEASHPVAPGPGLLLLNTGQMSPPLETVHLFPLLTFCDV